MMSVVYPEEVLIATSPHARLALITGKHSPHYSPFPRREWPGEDSNLDNEGREQR